MLMQLPHATRGRPAFPAEVVLRMMLLKHVRDWSYEELAREVRANLVYREFTRIGGGKVPDDKTMGRLGPKCIARGTRGLIGMWPSRLCGGRHSRVPAVRTRIAQT